MNESGSSQQDAKQATPSPEASRDDWIWDPAAGDVVAESTPTEGSGAGFYLRLALSLVLSAGVSAVILFLWAFQISDPCPCTGGFCVFNNPAIGGADAHLAGAGWGLGLLSAGVGLLIVSGYLVFRLRMRLAHPFMTLIVGFPVFYGCLLASTWALARGVWGPTRC